MLVDLRLYYAAQQIRLAPLPAQKEIEILKRISL